jgi:hypothetical protein
MQLEAEVASVETAPSYQIILAYCMQPSTVFTPNSKGCLNVPSPDEVF